MSNPTSTPIKLPGLDCGSCGYHTCQELAEQLVEHPELARRCIYLSPDCFTPQEAAPKKASAAVIPPSLCGLSPTKAGMPAVKWQDNLGREVDFYLEKFPEEIGPREIIIPHNPMLTRELEVQAGDVLIGRPLGMSCGCPVTHCGVAQQVDKRTGVITWCITGPLKPRQGGYKDLGYYIAEAYEGLVSETRVEIKIGMRYFFQPRMCMLQWRHSGLVNYINRTEKGLQIRVEGLWIG